MKKVAYFALVLSALLLVFSSRPAAALDPAFPADGDTLVYELRGSVDGVNTTGPNYHYPIEFDLSHEIVNHSGITYYANISVLMKEPADLLHLDPAGNETFFSLAHNYSSSGQTRYMHITYPLDWSMMDPSYYLDFFYIPQGTEAGDTVYMGYYDDYYEYLYMYGVPMGPGPSYTVDSTTLGTVGGSFEYKMFYEGPVDSSVSMISMEIGVSFYWEWSLGFLTFFTFNLHENLNPNYEYNYNITSVDAWGTFNLTDYTLTDTPSTPIITTPTTPTTGIPGFPIAAIGAGLLVALVPTIILRKRKR
ncbi:MAG: hypothetical protein ACFFDP_06075 [Promethearchaeota archaeon]